MDAIIQYKDKFIDKDNILSIITWAIVTIFLSIQAWNQSPTTDMAILLWVIALFRLAFERKKEPLTDNHKRVIWAGIAVFIGAALSWYFSPYAPLPFKRLEPDLRFILIGLVFISLYRTNISIKHIIISLSIASVSYGFSALYQTYELNLYRVHGDENAVTFGNGAFLVFSLTLFGASFFKNYWQKIIIIILSLFSLYAAIRSGTRGSFLAVIPLILFYLIYIKPKTKHLLLAVAVILSVSSSAVIFTDLEKRLSTAYKELSIYHKATKTSSGQRLEQWKGAACIFLEYPILGAGTRAFKESLLEYKKECDVDIGGKGTYSQAHSFYFNTLATKGLIGCTLMLIFIITIIKLTKTLPNDQRLLIYVFLITTASYGLTVDLIFKTFMIDKHLILLAILLSIREKTNERINFS